MSVSSGGPSNATTGQLRSLFLEIEFPIGFTTIGSAPECDLRLSGHHIEPLHACIIAGPNGVLLYDLSTSGIRVNGSAITRARRLNNRARLQIGGERFVFGMAPAKNRAAGDDHERSTKAQSTRAEDSETRRPSVYRIVYLPRVRECATRSEPSE